MRRNRQSDHVEAAVLPVWPLARALAATNGLAVLVLTILDDSGTSLVGSFVYLAVVVAMPIVAIAVSLAALGYRYGVAEPLVVCGAAGAAWLTWGPMIAAEGSDSLATAAVLFLAELSGAGVHLWERKVR
jgi:hypothetical protein